MTAISHMFKLFKGIHCLTFETTCHAETLQILFSGIKIETEMNYFLIIIARLVTNLVLQ